jgi:hypothetical protein
MRARLKPRVTKPHSGMGICDLGVGRFAALYPLSPSSIWLHLERQAHYYLPLGIAFDTNGVLVDGQHRLAAIVEADLPVELTVFTEVGQGAFDVLDTGKRRNAADILAIEGENGHRR